MHDGKSASQYPPGWPAFLIVFRALHIHQLANPALVGALGVLLSACLKRLEVRSETRLPLLAMALLCPFTLFNGASWFSHLLASVATVGICYLQIRDDVDPSFWRKAGIGALISALLVTRHDSFLIVAAVFVIDRVAGSARFYDLLFPVQYFFSFFTRMMPVINIGRHTGTSLGRVSC